MSALEERDLAAAALRQIDGIPASLRSRRTKLLRDEIGTMLVQQAGMQTNAASHLIDLIEKLVEEKIDLHENKS